MAKIEDYLSDRVYDGVRPIPPERLARMKFHHQRQKLTEDFVRTALSRLGQEIDEKQLKEVALKVMKVLPPYKARR